MNLFIPKMTEEALEPRIVLVTISGLFRIKQVGVVFFVEQLKRVPRVEDGKTVYEDTWRVIAGARPDTARKGRTPFQEAVEFMHKSNEQVLILMEQERRKQHAQPR